MRCTERQSRLFLSHLGFLSLDNLKRLSLVDDNKRFRRSLKDLDKIQVTFHSPFEISSTFAQGRQVFKAGIVYVQEGQEDQKVILKNDAGTKEYKEFVEGLGWSIDPQQHSGFLGGLDSSSGKTAPYFANATNELVWHCSTRLPTVESDPQQIQKVV